MQYRYFFSLLIFSTLNSQAQDAGILAIRKYTEKQSTAILKEFAGLLAIPNVAADSTGLRETAGYIMQMMRQRGIEQVKLLPSKTPGVPPVVYGQVQVPGATKTFVFYAHYDGQPVNPAQWAKGLTPFQPSFVSGSLDQGAPIVTAPFEGQPDLNWRIYARGASDDKAGVAAIINAYQALVQTGQTPSVNLKFFFEGEEEAGSPHLSEFLQQYKSLLASDCWIICDGPVHQSGKKQIVFGVRGDTHLDLTVYGPRKPLHSGHYGNWAPNPALELSKLLASMKDDRGRITIKGFYDDVLPLTATEKKALAEVPAVDDQMKQELGIRDNEMPGYSLVEAINLPSLNINGMSSGNTGKLASNQIPTYATAVLDLRMVMGNDWRKQQDKVIDHIRSKGFYVTDREPTDEERRSHAKIIKVSRGEDGYNAQRTPMDIPIAQQLIAAVKRTTPAQVVLQPTLGGSLPLYVFEQLLGAKTITVPIANHDNNQHAENENIRLRNFFEGIETMAAIMQVR